MSDLMEYKGYLTKVEYSKKENILFGSIQGIDDKVLFEGESITEFEKAFHESVDDYLELCAEMKKEPQKAYKGSFNVRISPDLHKRIAQIAMEVGKTLNDTIETAIRCYVDSINKELGRIGHRYISVLNTQFTPNKFEYEFEEKAVS